MAERRDNSSMVGQKFGKWLVTGLDLKVYANRPRPVCLCRCECGGERIILPAALRLGQSTQCRTCSNKIKANMGQRLIHGASETRLYSIWSKMRDRCSNPNYPQFHRYGGRGISVCPEWGEFSVFQAWAEANGYQANLTIDRRENDGGYEPDNCRWVDRTVQNRNRNDNKRYSFRGESLLISEIAERTGVLRSMLYLRIHRYGFDLERAVSQPVRGHPNHPTHRR